MPVLQLDDQQFPLLAGTTRVGAGGGADVPLPADPTLGVQALIDQAEGGGRDPLTIRRAGPAALVRVNGILLGAEPTPLMHGDRLEVGGVELRYADDTKGGATQYVNAGEMAALAGLRRAGAARATMASGGRVLSLVDGKEYSVPSVGLSFGRDATCGVVVAQNEVSRRHAEIASDHDGYVVRDTSANGVFVNGDRVQGSQRLARADVVRVGSEEFRFYADLPAAAPAPAQAAAPPAAALPAPAVAPVPVPNAAPRREDSHPVLASLEALNEGPAKGTRHLLHAAFVHVGRGAHNEVHLADDSVSETHAKLQRRQDGWYVTDLASTNGTYVDGKRILGDRRLDGAPDVRFGGIKMRFTEAGFDAAAGREGRKGTRAIASAERRPGRAPSSAAAARPGADAERTTRWVWVIGAIAVGAAAFFLFKGRA